MLPGVSPFTCPECEKDASRDRITLTRHYAFAHNKLFEMTDVTPEMLNPPSPKKQNITRKVQDEENVANHSQKCVEKKKDIKLEGKEDIKLDGKEDIKLEVKEDIQLEVREDVKLEVKEDIKLEMKEDIKLGVEEDIKEHLKLKERVAALGVKSDGNFVQWQKSFGKHDAQSGKRRNREGESKEERRERKEKRRMERREAKRCEEEEEKRNRVKREGCDKNEKEVPAAKPLFSLMMQELDNSSSGSGTSVRIIKGGEAEGKVKEFFVLCAFSF